MHELRSLLSAGKNADKLSRVDKQCKNLAASCYLNRHLYFPIYHLPDRCKDVGKPVIRINRVILLALHILICMNLIFSHAQRAINGKSYSNRYFFWATHTAPPTAQLHKCKKPNPGFVLTRDAKWLKCVTFFPVNVCTFILFLHQDFQGKQG